jgi:hypothetical protein
MIIVYTLLALSLILFLVHLWKDKQKRTKGRVIELFLLYQLIFNVGIMSFLAFYGHTGLSDYVAEHMGWTSSPFQQELANCNLAFGVLGILCIWFRWGFWAATVIGSSVWLFADGIHHIFHAVYHENYTDGNIGYPLYSDLIVPVVLVIALILYVWWNTPWKSKKG